ncbi:MAG: cellulase family glycosylhydrolase [Chthonomonadales bacterium]|nr:cellulase family glycosylhydrolase [Chthonomonadales bacterium]
MIPAALCVRAAALALLAASPAAVAGPGGAPRLRLDAAVPAGLGANIHFTDPRTGEMRMLADGGFRWVRMDFDWNAIETERGKYDFRAYDRLMAALQRHGIRPILILDYVHRLYDDAQSPHTPEGRAAMAAWAAASAVHFRGRGVLWEMYNEPNISPFWRPRPSVDDYVKLATAVGEAIRKAAPNEAYIGPATSTIDYGFLEACFRGGLLKYWDAVSVHPYRQAPPETAAADYRRLRLLIERYAPKGKHIPVLSGEWGYSSAWRGMDAERQGLMLPRQWLTNLANDVGVSIWYDWHDDGPDPKEPEHHFGTTYYPYHEGRDPVYDPKPAYIAAQALTTALRGYRFHARLMTGRAEDHVLLFARGDDVKLAAWTVDRGGAEARIPASPGRFGVVGHLGEALPSVVAGDDGLALPLTEAPRYLTPEEPNALLRVAAGWERLPLEALTTRDRYVPTARIRNPLDRAIVVRAADTSRRIRPGATAVLALPPVAVGRGLTPMSVRAELEVEGMGRLAQGTYVAHRQPLAATILPAAGALGRVRIQNPTGLPLRGSVELRVRQGSETEARSAPLRLSSGAREVIVELPLSGEPADAYSASAEVRAEDGKALLREGPRTFRHTDHFSRYGQGSPVSAYAVVAEGDSKVTSEQALSVAQPSDGPATPRGGSLRLDYRFTPGWKYLCIKPTSAPLVPIPGRPAGFGLWVHGDGRGNLARLRVTDSTGQTFQPDGGAITWRGWRYVEFRLDGSQGGHWGGAEDGVIHYPLRWETLFLLDSAGGSASEGTVYVAAPTLIYDGDPAAR